jgi:signal transduction histidine kinase
MAAGVEAGLMTIRRIVGTQRPFVCRRTHSTTKKRQNAFPHTARKNLIMNQLANPAPRELRRRAEDQLQDRPVGTSFSLSEAQTLSLTHELQVHQIELELQNHALQEAQAQIARDLEEFKSLYDLAPVAYLTLTAEGLIAKTNLLANKLLGHPLHSFVGLRFSRFVNVDSLPTYLKFIAQVFGKKRLEVCHLILQIADGRPPIYAYIEGVADDEAKECRLILRDLSEQKKSERAIADLQTRTETLVEAKLNADSANLAKTNFLANMSHEIRTPINAIIGTAHLLRKTGLTPMQETHLHKMDTAAKHLLGILNDILDLTKIDAEHITLESTAFRLSDLLSNIHQLVSDKLATKKLDLFDHPDSALLDLTLLGDSLRLQQVLLNLVNNAVKFTEFGHITLRARLEAETADQCQVLFEVQDTGPGIPAGDCERIFQAFEQLDSSTTRKHGGTGLGLAISQRLVQLMGGQIRISSKVGEGSIFSFSIPLGKQHHPAVNREKIPDFSASEAENFLRDHCQKKRILLVEDDQINQEIALSILHEELGLQIDLADDGAVAVVMADRSTYDLILMDMQMPIMDGLTATRAIRQLPGYQNTPILAMTANAFADDRKNCLQAGMNDFVTKPVDPERLFIVLAGWLQAG